MTLLEEDSVHLDFHHRNAVASNRRLTAVIDCDGYRSGDRVFDLVTRQPKTGWGENPILPQRPRH
ncbi:MAG: aminoglycoside phosphotransferase family protein [Actinomycetota bacterium]|nr:aminoglycoside phosphotransferase family protein [Actinomycetota bacterium]